MSELKPLPCPFCGGAPQSVERPDNIDGTRFFYALACHCGGYSACAHKMAVEPTPEQAKSAAIEAWNRRAQPAQAGQVLTRDDIVDAWMAVMHIDHATQRQEAFARAIEQAVRAKLGAGVGWIACEDQMPPPDAWLLVAWDGGRVDKAHTFNKWEHPTNPLGYLIQGHPGAHADVTHWMPLPPPPGIVSGKGGA